MVAITRLRRAATALSGLSLVVVLAAGLYIERSQPLGATDVLSDAHGCLRKSQPTLQLRYPADAEAHFEEVQRALARWSTNHHPHSINNGTFFGPWIENMWIRRFATQWADRAPGDTLRQHFGPYVPIFVPWTDRWVEGENRSDGVNGARYPYGLPQALERVLRKDVAYITVVQNDQVGALRLA